MREGCVGPEKMVKLAYEECCAAIILVKREVR
jgi:hypothetical protein